MATLDQLKVIAEEELGFEVSDTDVLIASYLCHGMAQLEICDILGVPGEDLKQLVASEEFQSIRQVLQLEIARSKMDVDGGWDSAERTALMAINEYAEDNVLDIDTALKIAQVANKADRRGDKGSQVIGGQQGGLVTISLKQTFVQAIQDSRGANEMPEVSRQILVGESVPIEGSAEGASEETDSKLNRVMKTPNGGNQVPQAKQVEQVEQASSPVPSAGLGRLAQSVQPSAGELNSILGLDEAVKIQGGASGNLLDDMLSAGMDS